MNLGIEGKVALVVGASTSMGREVALVLAREGCAVIAVARREALLRSLCEEAGEACHWIAYDMMLPQAAAVIDKEIRVIAGQSPDIIYHAMGGSYENMKEWHRPASDWREVWRFNLGVAHNLNRLMIPDMVARKWGRVVHTSSDAVKCSIGNAPYTSSKFAVEGYVKTTAKLFSQHGVIVSAVAPGPIYTEGRWIYSQSEADTERYFDNYLPIRRFGRAAEVAEVVAFLCSQGAGYMAGAVVPVDGGSR